MIEVDKHTNIDLTIVSVSAVILEVLRPQQSLTYLELLKKVTSKIGDAAAFNYPYGLDFLYLIGVIDYDLSNDLITRHETK